MIALSGGEAPRFLPAALSSRDELLAEMAQLDATRDAVRAFEGAGASAPIRLGRADREVLAVVIEGWADEVGKGDLPAGIWDLRLALADDLEA
jgi:hypothetical protein